LLLKVKSEFTYLTLQHHKEGNESEIQAANIDIEQLRDAISQGKIITPEKIAEQIKMQQYVRL
jgi:hypothetical protein